MLVGALFGLFRELGWFGEVGSLKEWSGAVEEWGRVLLISQGKVSGLHAYCHVLMSYFGIMMPWLR